MGAQNRNRTRLTEGPVGQTLARLTIPMIWGLIAIMSSPIVDAYFVGQLGTKELAAIAYIMPLGIIISSVTLGLTVGTSVVVARLIGEDDWGKVRRTVSHAILLGMLFIVILLTIGTIFVDDILRAQNAPEAFFEEIKSYLGIWIWAMVPLAPTMVANGALRANGDSMAASHVMLATAIGNIILDPVLIFGFGPIPALGFNGAAWATLGANLLSTLVALYYVGVRDRLLIMDWPSWSDVKVSWTAVLVIGAPSAMANIISPLSRGGLNNIVSDFGPAAVAGFGVAFQLEFMALIIPLALSSIIGPFIGQNQGAGRIDRMREAMGLSVAFCFIYGLIISGLLYVGGVWIAQQFQDDPATVQVITEYMNTVPWTYGFYGVIMITGAAFNAMGNPKPNFSLYFVKFAVIYVPVAWIASQSFAMMGVYGAAAISNVIAGLIALSLVYARFAKTGRAMA